MPLKWAWPWSRDSLIRDAELSRYIIYAVGVCLSVYPCYRPIVYENCKTQDHGNNAISLYKQCPWTFSLFINAKDIGKIPVA